MKNKSILLLGLLLIISVLLNLILLLNVETSASKLESFQEDMKYIKEERLFLSSLIEKVKPSVKKEELKKIIQEMHPDEKVEVLFDHVRWRFFNFWYSEDGDLEKITYGS